MRLGWPFKCWLSLVCLGLLSGCAEYQVQSNKERSYSKEIDRLYAWSALAQAPQLGSKRLLQSDTFSNWFHAALKRDLAAAGVTAEVREFIATAETPESLARFETDFSPSFRLLVIPTKAETMTYQGITSVKRLVLDLSLIEIAGGRRVWRAQLVVDAPLGGPWGEDQAKNLSGKIIEALRKDALLASSTAGIRSLP